MRQIIPPLRTICRSHVIIAQSQISRQFEASNNAEGTNSVQNDRYSITLVNSIYERDGEWKLSFGTAGIRACLGSGAAEINPATMGRFVNGVAAWLLSTYGAEACAGRGVVIGYDARYFSTDFAALGAALLTARSISVRIFPEYTPTPLIAYAVRPLGALLGLCFTASHNPAEYNGCKLYGEDGVQAGEEITAALAEYIPAAAYPRFKSPTNYHDPAAVRSLIETGIYDRLDVSPAEQAETTKLIRKYLAPVPQSLAADYRRSISSGISEPPAEALDISILYTAMHGTGAQYMLPLLFELGFRRVDTVAAQIEPDPRFPTAPRPNPESPEAMTLVLEQAERTRPDLVLATDPDADRLAVAIPDDRGDYLLLTGNQTGALLFDYLAQNYWNGTTQQAASTRQTATQSTTPALVKTIVTDDFARDVAEHYSAVTRETLTGFKHISSVMLQLRNEERNFVPLLGFEESIGFAVGDAVRDKDGIAAGAYLAAAARQYAAAGLTLYDRLLQLNELTGGWHASALSGYEFAAAPGKSGKEIGDELYELFGSPGIHRRLADCVGLSARRFDNFADCPGPALRTKAGRIHLGEHTVVALRPSGTEPKLKFYIWTVGENRSAAEQRIAVLQTEIAKIVAETSPGGG